MPVLAAAQPAPAGAPAGPPDATEPAATAAGQPLALNSASADQLATLPGVGPDLARSIVALREQRGALGSVEELRVLPEATPEALASLRRDTVVDVTLTTRADTTPKTVDEVLARFADEPDVQEVQRMAVEYTHTHRDQVQRWLDASRRAAALPELRLEYQYEDNFNITDHFTEVVDNSGQVIYDDYPYDADRDQNHQVDVKLKWRLDDLVMSSEQIRVISEAQDIVKLRDKVLSEVTRIYFDRRRAQVEMLLSPKDDLKGQVEAQLRIMELTAELDAYTGGAFSQALAARSGR